MNKKILVVVDVQNDFIDGALGNDETKAIVPKLVKKLKKYGKDYDSIYLTRDIHYDNYLDTLEGKKLPVPHCIKKSGGESINKDVWEAVQMLRKQKKYVGVVDKNTFASKDLIAILSQVCSSSDEIELCGVCTDICVVANAIGLRTAMPNTVIKVDSHCCAGTSINAHNAALRTMASCQVDVIGRHYGENSESTETTEVKADTDKSTQANEN